MKLDQYLDTERFVSYAEDYIAQAHSGVLIFRYETLKNRTDLEVTLMGMLAVIIISWAYYKMVDFIALTKKRGLIRLLLALPIVNIIVRMECEKSCDEFKAGLPKTKHEPLKALPNKPWSKDQVIARLNDFQADESSQIKSGKFSGVLFTDRKNIIDIAQEASSRFLYTNIMYYARTGPSRQLENEIIQFTRAMLKGTPEMSGLTTSGGSESIFLSMLAHKRYFLREKGIDKPNVVLSESAHLAFRKACDFQEIEMRILPVNRKTLCNTGDEYEAQIDCNTICMICSCPNFPYGTIDPIEDLSAIAKKYGVGMHLDGCMGSYLLPFCERFGVKTGHQYVDLRIPNITAFTIDTHKYGLTPKGSGVIIFPNKEISKALYWGCTDWIGGIYGTTMIAGSRTSALIAAAWAVMVTMGEDGYAAHAKQIFDATDEYVELLGELKDYIRVVGNPKLGNVTFVSNNRRIDMYKLGTLMDKKGWYFGSGMGIRSLMFTITDKNFYMMKDIVADLRSCIDELLVNPSVKLHGFFKIAHDIRFTPAWITSKVVADSLQELYEVEWLEHDDAHKKKLEETL
jgi:sphinganine-1-phosphate aldolase